MLTLEHLKRALQEAAKCDASDTSPSAQARHARRSREWVKCLATELKGFSEDPDVRVFFKGDPQNREDFGLNELLYDVCVCETKSCPSARRGKTLRYVTKALWQVESEFARDSFEAVEDFNKLVIGSADNKLFIGPRLAPSEQSQFLDALLPVARCCSGNVYVAAVSHPDEWEPNPPDVSLWQLAGGAWQPR
jgi:hypothetical protein